MLFCILSFIRFWRLTLFYLEIFLSIFLFILSQCRYNSVEPQVSVVVGRIAFANRRKYKNTKIILSIAIKIAKQRYKKYIKWDAEIKKKKRKINKILFWLLFCRKKTIAERSFCHSVNISTENTFVFFFCKINLKYKITLFNLYTYNFLRNESCHWIY